MLQSPIINQQLRQDLVLAERLALIDSLKSDLDYLSKQWARHGVDFETLGWAEVQENFARLSEIDAVLENPCDPRPEYLREQFTKETDEKIAKAQAPIRAAYAAKYPSTAEAA